MMFLALGACLALAAFLTVSLAVSLLALLVWRVVERNLEGVAPAARAGSLFLLRMWPAAAAALVVFGLFLPAFYAFEPRQTAESVGPSLLALAALAVLLIAGASARVWRASHSTRRLVGDWLKTAQPVHVPGASVRVFSIDADFPVVTVEGILRPRLFISRRVLAECTPEELSAMIHHECGHIASADNLKRLAFRLAADPLSFTRAGRELEERWHDAAEEVADDFTARTSPRAALALAHALVRVARMAPGGRVACSLPLLHSGDSIERRVRRLIGSEPSARRRPGWVVAVRTLMGLPPVLVLAVLLDPALLRGVYHVIEAVVETLP
jgi:Zn-dependent protease with chaperone function